MRPMRLSLPTPFAVGPVNAYLFVDDPVTLVDPGPDYSPAREALEHLLAERGLSVADVRQIIVTHYHPDHAGLAPALAHASGATLRMHPETARRLGNPYSGEQELEDLILSHGVPLPVLRAMHQELGRIVGFLAPLGQWEPLLDGSVVHAGGTELECLLTPGHASGHLALQGGDYLIGGDLLIHGITPNPVLEVDERGARVASLPQYLESVARVRGLGPLRVLAGHRREIPDPEPVIATFHEEVAARQRAVQDALQADGPMSAFALSQRFFPLERGADPFLALGEMMGHLDLLEAAGAMRWVSGPEGTLLAAG